MITSISQKNEAEGKNDDGEGMSNEGRGIVDRTRHWWWKCGGGGGCGGGWWIGILVTALLWLGGVGNLGGTTEVTVSKITAANVIDTGKLPELVEILFCAAVLSVTTLTLWAIFTAILAAVQDGLHTQSSMDLSPIVMTETFEVPRTILVRLAGGLLVCLI